MGRFVSHRAGQAPEGALFSYARVDWWYAALAIVVAALICLGGWAYHRHLSERARATVQDSLSTIADLKAEDLANWMKERRGDAEVVRESIVVEETMAHPGDARVRDAAIERARVFREVYGYAAIIFADANGKALLNSPDRPPAQAEEIAEHIQVALRSNNVVISDLRQEDGKKAYLWLSCPVVDTGRAHARPEGAVLLLADPETFIYPAIETWPTLRKTGETLLAVRQGDEIVFMNSRRYWSERVAAQEPRGAGPATLAEAAAKGTEGVYEVTDERGARVFAALRKIQDTPWLLLAKVDEQEIMAPRRLEARNVFAITALLALASTMGIGMLWREQRLVYARRELEEREQAARHISQLNRLYEVLSAISDLIIRERDQQALFDAACRIAVETGRFPMAWIGMVDEEAKTIRPAACAGAADGYLNFLAIDLHDAARSAEPSAQAYLTGESQVNNDLRNEPFTKAWRDAALRRGYRSCASFPLKAGGRPVGAFTLVAGEADIFDPDELRLLEELTGNISFALEVNQRETARRGAEEKLRQSEERFRQLIENASDMITVVNNEGVLRFASPAVKRSLGYEPGEVQGRNAGELMDSHDLAGFTATLRKVVEDPSMTAPFEYKVRHRDGSWRVLQSVGRSIPGQAEDGFVVVNSRDITEQRQLEEQFRQSQKMEGIGQLAGGVAHDFNNILSAILAQTELTETVENLPESVYGSLRQVRNFVERAANLTRQLLLFSRRQVMQPRDLDLNESVKSFSKMLQRIIGENVRLETHLSPSVLATRADPGMLDQVLMNLVINARDAMPQGGTLTIETSEKRLTRIEAERNGAAPERHVCLKVTDTGSGIARDALEHIFEPFYTTKPPGKGTGLGLATVFGIVKQHGGAISVESEVGRGTTFQIFLPASNAKAVSAAAAEKAAARGGKETILLVEDETAVRRLSGALLELAGYRVLEAANGVEALDVWREHRDEIGLLLTDLVMPESVSGRELAARLRAEKGSLPIVFISGYSAELAGQELVLQDGQNLIQKPCSQNQLLETVRRSLDHSRVGAKPFAN